MSLGREQLVLVGTVLVLVLVGWMKLSGEEGPTRGPRRAAAPELEAYSAPDLDLVLPPDAWDEGALRALFTPPRDTRPLPPLALAEPPLPELPGIAPPPSPGPAPGSWGTLLRTRVERVDVPGLFDELDATLAGGGAFDAEFFGVGDDGGAEEAGGEPESPPDPFEGPAYEPLDDLAARTARLESYRRLYDWIQLGAAELLFGRIENRDRFALDHGGREAEALLFTVLDPETGEERFAGQEAIEYERSRVSDWGFADTASNRIEKRYRDADGVVTPGTYVDRLALAEEALLARRDVPRGVEVAESLFRACAEYDASDPRPRLGIARCREASFDFEGAFDVYQGLLERFDHRAEVHVGLASLERRFLLYDSAEARLARALELERGAWTARWAMGRLLLERGRFDEARTHLAVAMENAPTEPHRAPLRYGIRADLAEAHLALGEVAEAARLLPKTLRVAPGHERTIAMLFAVEELAGAERTGDEDSAAELAAEVDGAGFELALARARAQLRAGEWGAAREGLEQAADSDPLRAAEALRVLSWLAERTSHPELAASFAEQAHEADPTDLWVLFQRGRLAARAEDDEAAAESLHAVLALHPGLVDALVELGEIARRDGRSADAARYLRRALELEPGRADVWTRRALAELSTGDVAAAEAGFDRALTLDPDDAAALGGYAWCVYLGGDPDEATNLLARIDDDRREFGDEDPLRLWARAQIERLRDHLEKVAWTDGFERASVRKGWAVEEQAGPRLSIEEGVLRFHGTFDENGAVRVYQTHPASQFVSIEGSVRIAEGTAVRAGLFVARERQRSRTRDLLSEASVSRHRDGTPQVRFLSRGELEPDVRDLAVPFPVGEWVRLRIERSGDASEATVTLFVDGVPVVENEPMRDLGRANTPLFMGFFAEGEVGRELDLEMDDVEIVHRRPSG
jgi:tetratricopeptide (TPR) repeat protein